MKFILKHKNYLITFSIEFIILILSFLVYRIANQNMTEHGFSEYTLSRRGVSFLLPLFMIGLGVAVPRYTSIYPKHNSFFTTGLTLITLACFTFISIILFKQEYFATLFFGDQKYSNYIFPLVLLLFGYCVHAILYGFLRGKHNVYFSNILQLVNRGLLPIVVVLYTNNIIILLYVNGLILIFNCFILSFFILKKYPVSLKLNKFIVDTKTLLTYGLPRVLGDFSLLILLTAPTYLILYLQNDILISGDVAYSITLLNLIAAAFGPLGLVLLPEIAHFMSQKRIDLIKKRFYIFISISMVLTVIGYAIYYYFSNQILTLLLGNNFRTSINSLSHIILIGCFGYTLYIILRSFLDAIKVKATNAFNLIITLLLYSIMVGYNYNTNGSVEEYLYSFAISINILGLLTLLQTFRAIKKL